MTEEITIFQDQDVSITNLRAVIQGKTYAVSNITSVGAVQVNPSGCLPISLFLIGAVIILPNLSDISEGLAEIFTGIIFIILGVVVIRASKPRYVLQISTAAGEVKALTSHNKDYITKVTSALNDAIVKKG